MTMPVMTLPVRYRSLAPIAILAALHAVPAAAQRIDDARVAPGAAVRVALTNGESQTGQYAAQSPTHLHLNRECGEGCLRADSIAWNDVRRVDAKLTLRHSGGRALIFGLAGAAIGTVVTLGAMELYRSSSACDGDLCGLGFVLALPVAAGTGALIGIHHGWTEEVSYRAPVWPPSATR
jgi:hypothetical protein